LSLGDLLINNIFGRRSTLGAKEFKERLCAKYNVNSDAYQKLLKEIAESDRVELRRGRIMLKEWGGEPSG